jgi:cysteinyl-tRNA synthetase
MSEPTLRLYNSATRSLEPLETASPGKVGIYVCGMTVYDYCHIGHARAMISFDMVVRHLRHKGFEVNFVRNHTDVDDKIIARAAETGRDPLELSAFFIDELDQDLDALGLIKPDVEPRVSDHIPQIVAMVETLVDKGHAYEANGSVYFAVETFENYGQLSGRILEDLIAGERVKVDPEKRSPADFALWKASKEGEISWESPWGSGRPGWHIECSAMSCEHLGASFEIHGGGIDLIFPHHENEIAQSVGATGESFARYWLHNGHVNMGAEKMSKSLGNIVRIRDILEEVPGEALKLLYLGAHYRSPIPYSSEALAEAVGSLDRIYQAIEIAQEMAAKPASDTGEDLSRDLGEDALALWGLATEFPARFDEAMDQDFNSAKALGHVFELVRAVNRAANAKAIRKRGSALFVPAAAAFSLAAKVLGIGAAAPGEFFDELKVKRMRAQGTDPSEIDARLADRDQARADKDWARADSIREELDVLGVIVMDGPAGSTWRARVD